MRAVPADELDRLDAVGEDAEGRLGKWSDGLAVRRRRFASPSAWSDWMTTTGAAAFSSAAIGAQLEAGLPFSPRPTIRRQSVLPERKPNRSTS